MSFDHSIAQKFKNRWLLRAYMLRRLPMGLLSGMIVESLDERGCTVVLKDRWWIHNPFGSVFWAVMGMAAELSTGALVYAYASGSKTKFILVGMEGRFLKKAKGKSFYFCDSGQEVQRSFEKILNTDDPCVVILPVVAKDQAGQVLAEFKFEWQLRKPIS